MAQNAEIFFEHDSWGRALGWSAGSTWRSQRLFCFFLTFLADRAAVTGAVEAAVKRWE
jgi:hypothetical protein